MDEKLFFTRRINSRRNELAVLLPVKALPHFHQKFHVIKSHHPHAHSYPVSRRSDFKAAVLVTLERFFSFLWSEPRNGLKRPGYVLSLNLKDRMNFKYVRRIGRSGPVIWAAWAT